MRNIYAFLVVLLFVSAGISAQSGPGGVGNLDDVIVWLKADEGVTKDGSNIVSAWADQSSYGFEAAQSTASWRPTYVADGGADFNNYPVIRFDYDFLSIPDDDNLDGADGLSIIMVLKPNNVTRGWQGILAKCDDYNDQEAYNTYLYDGDLRFNINNNYVLYGNTELSISSSYIISNTYGSSRGSIQGYYNSTGYDSYNYSSSVSNMASDLHIGTYRPYNDTRSFQGDIAEIIIYKTGLNNAQRLILENYLSQKYGISVSSDIFSNPNGYFTDYTGIGQESDGSVTSASSAGFYVSENGNTVDNGEYITFAHNNSANSVVETDITGSVEERWDKDWYLEKTGTINADITFDFAEGIPAGLFPQTIGDYVLLYRSGTSGDYSVVSGATASIGDADQVVFSVLNADLQDGYYTIGTTNQTDSPVIGKAGITYYAVKSGDWDEASTWTLDPAAAVYNNPGGAFPSLATDNIVIKTGKTITVPSDIVSTINCANIKVDGRLDFGSTNGHSFNVLRGSGRILLSGNDNYPSFNDDSHFVTAGEGEGTVVYYGDDLSVVSSQEFYNVEVKLNASQTLTCAADMTINGDITVMTGKFQINNTSATKRTITVYGDFNVNADGEVGVGKGIVGATDGNYHELVLKGNFKNEGIAKFTNRTTYGYTSYDGTGAVDVIFNNTTSNQTLQCKDETVFNQITCDKGTDATFMLEVSATATSNFKLYGRNDESYSGDDDNGGDKEGNKALNLLAGTLKLGSNIVIPELAADDNYTIDTDACLWIAESADVSVVGGYVALYGKLRISDNAEFNASDYGIAILLRNKGTFLIEGGTANLNNFTTSARLSAGDHVGAYMQTGGVTNILDDNGQADFTPFHLPFASNVFQMSGGQLNVLTKAQWSDSDDYSIVINCAEGNYNVTGGEVVLDMSWYGDYYMTSTAPFYDFTVKSSLSTTHSLIINNLNVDESTSDVEDVAAYPLRVLNDFTIEGTNSPTFNANGNNVEIGGDFIFKAGANYTTGDNKTIFNGSQNSVINIEDNSTASDLQFDKLVIEKDVLSGGSHYNVSIAECSGRSETPNAGTDTEENTIISINDSVIINRGDFQIERYTVNLEGHATIADGSILTDEVNPGRLALTGGSSQTLYASNAYDNSYGRIELYNTAGATLKSNISIAQLIMERDVVLNTESNKLSIGSGGIVNSGSFGTSRMIMTDGSIGAGGLELPIDLTVEHAADAVIAEFPVGVSGRYAPFTLYANTTFTGAASGTIVINPVNSAHPAASGTKIINFYWRQKSDGFGENDLVNIKSSADFNETIDAQARTPQCLYNNSWVSSGSISGNQVINYNAPGGVHTEADYTAGSNGDFNQPRVLYSITDGEISSKSTWSEGGHGGSATNQAPKSYDILIVGGTDTRNDSVWIGSDGFTCAKLTISESILTAPETGESYGSTPTVDISTTTGHTFNSIEGGGKFRTASNTNYASPHIPSGDWDDFMNSEKAVFEYYGTAQYTMPTTVSTYPTLRLNDSGNYKITPGIDIVVNNDFEIYGGYCFVNPWETNADVYVSGDLVFSDAGTLMYYSTGPARAIWVEGSVLFPETSKNDPCDILINTVYTGSISHSLYVGGDIRLGSSEMEFWAGSNYCDIKLIFNGDGNSTVYNEPTNHNGIALSQLVIDKAISSATVEFFEEFTLNESTNGSVNTKALYLKKGDLTINNLTTDDASDVVDITLSSGGDDFAIPSESALRVKNATVGVSGTDIGIYLDGLMEVGDGSTWNINEGTNNYIEYSATGTATINIEEGELYVGSHIRRPTTSDVGVLSFNHNKANSAVVIGTDDYAEENNRGVFEITGETSSFIQVEENSNIVIAAQQSSPSVAALYFDPGTVSIANACSFTLGGDAAQTASSQAIGIYATKPLRNLKLSNASGNNPSAKIWTTSLQLEGDLMIDADTEFDANGLDLIIEGDMVNSGDFTSNQNATYFSGNVDQSITGVTEFYNLSKDGTALLQLNSNIEVSNNLSLTDGAFDCVDSELVSYGNVYSSIVSSASGTSVGGITFNSNTEIQELTGGGTFAKLTVSNPYGVNVPTEAQITTITGELRLEEGIFDIGKNLLTLTSDASIEEITPFDEANMIQTYISFTDAGIKKYFPYITATESFVYPIGSTGKYTPVTLDINTQGNTAGDEGYIRVKAANEPHISIPAADQDRVLQYNWTLDAGGITNFDATGVMKGETDDILGDGSLYIAAKLLDSDEGYWERGTDYNEFNETTAELYFDFDGTDDLGIDGDYTAGERDAIPEKVQTYISVADGSWDDANIWAVYDVDTDVIGVAGVGVAEGGPTGSIVRVVNNVYMTDDYNSAYQTSIENTGTSPTGILRVLSTTGHRLGDVKGSGELIVESGDLPAGVYDDFFASTGGTLEYTGSTGYDILSEITSVNNLTLSGSDERRLPNVDFYVVGNLVYEGSAEVINEHSCDIYAQGDITFNGGTYETRTGGLILAGSSLQTVSGTQDFTSTNSLYSLEIDNIAEANVELDMEVTNELVLTNGVINTKNVNGSLTVTNSLTEAVVRTGSNSFVEGPLAKSMNSGSSFDFPVGAAGRYGNIVVDNVSSGGYWEAEYFNNNPGDDGYSPDNRVESPEADKVAYVSHNEYWRVEAPDAGNTANLTLRWDDASGVTPNDEFRVVRWTDLSPDDLWSKVEVGTIDTDEETVNLKTDLTFGFSGSDNSHYITFGSISIPAYTWVGNTNDWFTASNWSNLIVPGASADVTINSVAVDKFDPVIDPEISADVVNMNDLNIGSGGSLTLKAGAKMSINGNLTTNNGLMINNATTSPSSVIAYGTVTGNATYSWPLTAREWWYIAHPVTGVTKSEYETAFPGDTYALNIWDGSWDRVAGAGENYADYLFTDPIEGYSLILRDGGTLTYSGALNRSTPYSATNMDAGYHLVANPYPSYIDVEDESFNMGSFDKTVYIRKSNNEVSTYNLQTNEGLLGGSRYVSPGQCMWLHTATANDAISISSSMRTHFTGGYGLKSAVFAPNDRIRLKLESENGSDESVVIFNDNGSELVTDFDSEKVMNGGSLASLFSIKENKNMAINSLPELSSTDIVSLGYNVAESGMGDFTISVSNIDDFMPGTDVYLYDKDLDITINLRDERSYTFTPATAQANDRFELRFESSVTTDMDNGQTVSQRNVLIYAAKQQATVRVTEEILQAKNRLIEVYSVTGQLVAQHDLNGTETTFELPQANAIYVIKVSVDNSAYQQKVISMQ